MSLATDVVFPVPLTPTTKIVVALPSATFSSRDDEVSAPSSAARIADSALSDFVARAIERISSLNVAPRSDSIKDERSSSQSLSETPPIRSLAKILLKSAMALNL